MSLYIFNLRREERDVGKRIKLSKRHFKWEFCLNNNNHKVEAFHSKLSGKKRILVDGVIVVKKTELTSLFVYSFSIDNSYCQIVQDKNDKFELIIDNFTFSKMLEQQSRMMISPNIVQVVRNNDNINYFWKEEAQQNEENKKKDNSNNFFNGNDFDFSVKASTPKSNMFSINKNSLLSIKPDSKSYGSNKNSNVILDIDDIFSNNCKIINENQPMVSQSETITNKLGSKSSNNIQKAFDFENKFNDPINHQETVSTTFNYNKTLSPNITSTLNNPTVKSSKETSPSKSTIKLDEKQEKCINNDLKQKLINSNLINFNNILDNNVKKEVKKNSVFSGTPLNQIQINNGNNFNFNNKF